MTTFEQAKEKFDSKYSNFLMLTEDEFKQIQLDAMKEGMRRSANVCKNHTNNACNVGFASQYDCEQSILTAAEQLTMDKL